MQIGIPEVSIGESSIQVSDGNYSSKYPKAHEFLPSGIPFVSANNLSNGRIIRDNLKFISEKQHASLKKGHVRTGDVLLVTRGSLGTTALVTREFDDANINAQLVLLRADNATVDSCYLFFVANSPAFQRQLASNASGTAQPQLPIGPLKRLTIPLPPLPVQRRIAGILSAYDELIENSQRRIRIQESMARALYREWFVQFRYPGHEKVPRVASPLGEIPRGWEVKSVADSFEISGGGTPSRKEEAYWDGGTIQWFSPSDLTGAGTMFMDDSSDHITVLGLAESSARLFPARSVMLTSRATIGAIAINTHEACTNQGFITCIPNERVPLYFLFHWLTENVPTFQRMASGATFKEISRGVFKTINHVHPPTNLVNQFEDAAMPMAEQALWLQRQIQTLRRTRDLLLPRLLSGQVKLTTN